MRVFLHKDLSLMDSTRMNPKDRPRICKESVALNVFTVGSGNSQLTLLLKGFPGGASGKNPAANAGLA